MTKKKPPMVVITWEDAAILDTSAWADNEDHQYKARMFETIGFLLYEGPDGVIITSSWSDETVAARDQIPRGMIHKVRRIKS